MDMEIPAEIVETAKKWIKEKIRVHVRARELYFNEREIWWASVGWNVGSEINGKGDHFERPVLVFKKVSNTTAYVLPITSTFEPGSMHHYPFVNQQGVENAVVLSQLRLMSTHRFIRKVKDGKLSGETFAEIQSAMIETLGIKYETPLRGNLGASLRKP